MIESVRQASKRQSYAARTAAGDRRAARRLPRVLGLATLALALLATLAPAAFGAQSIYWANLSGNKISVANADGTGSGFDLDTTGATVSAPLGLAADEAANKIYWVSTAANKVSVANLDGTGGGSDLSTTGATVSGPRGVAINPATNKIYWANWSGNKISVANLDGTGGGGDLNTSGATVNNPAGIAIDAAANKIYWANQTGNKISVANLDGSGGGSDLGTAGATVNGPIGVAIDPAANKIYWANYSGNNISVANLDGTGGGSDLDTTGATMSQPVGVAIDPDTNRIYWANRSVLSVANLDGSGGGSNLDTTGATVSGAAFPVVAGTSAYPTPQITGSDPSSPANSTNPKIKGTVRSDATVDLFTTADCSGTPIATGTAAAFASPGFSVSVADDSSTTYKALATYSGGQSTCSAGFTYVEDSTDPDTTIDSGPSGLTNNASPSFGFSSNEGGSSFECKLDSGSFQACSSPKAYSGLSDGAHSFEVRATDQAGNTDPSPATRGFTLDTVAPNLSIDSGPSGPTTNPSPSFGFTAEGGSTVSCSIDTGTPSFGACSGAGTHSPAAPLADDAYTFRVRATDAAGNQTTQTQAFSVDTQPPNTTVDSGPSGLTNNASPSFGFSSSEGGSTFECKLDSGSFEACSSPKAYSGLGEGAHSFEVRATDPVGNTDASPATRNFTVDTQVPDTTIDSGPSGLTNSASPSFGFSSADGTASFECKLDSGSFEACSSPKAYAGLGEGAHSFEVRAKDPAGNVDASPATRNFTVDTQAPNTTINSGPSGPTNNASPSFSFSSTEGGSTFECKLDSGSFEACSSPKAYAGLGEGAHSFEVRATDPAGNTDASSATRNFTVDTQAPNTTINSGPSGLTNNASPSFGFSSTEGGSTFECKLDSGSFQACSTPKAYAGLANGPHGFEVRSTDPAGNTDASPATRNFTVDTIAPSLVIDSGPSGPTTNPSPSFGFTAEGGSTVSCSIETGSPSFGPCSGAGSHSPAAPLADNSYSFRVRAIDAAGNQTTASRDFAVDTAAPNTTIVSGPTGPTGPSPSFGFSSTEGGSTFECRLDLGSFEPCTSPKAYSGLTDGPHSFEARATDPVGNTDASPASRAFSVDPAIVEPDCAAAEQKVKEAKQKVKKAKKKVKKANKKVKKAKSRTAKKKAKKKVKSAKKKLKKAKKQLKKAKNQLQTCLEAGTAS